MLNLISGHGKMKSSILIILFINLSVWLPAQPGTGAFIFTDRNLYVTGEKILFSASLVDDTISTVFYAELVTPDGGQLASGKFLVYRAHVSGRITIPSGLLSGNYYLRGYTREMRNAGPETFGYAHLKIVNPYRNEVSLDFPENDTVESIPVFYFNNRLPDIETDKQELIAGDSLRIKITGNLSSFRGLNATIVPFWGYDPPIHVIPGKPEEKNFSPELNGVTLSGFVSDGNDGKAESNTRVNLSVMGAGRDFMATETDANGRFFFTLRGYAGFRDLFLFADRKDGTDNRIFVDNDFFAMPVRIISENFMLTDEEREAAIRIAANFQVDSAFNKASLQREEALPEIDALFYGTPYESIIISDFVRLPTLEEYFNELPSLVHVRKKDGKRYFRVLGTQAELTEMDPLVLVDMVPVPDADKVLGADPEKVERIDIINSVYVKGDLVSGGIISIISNKGDFAGIDLPSSGVFIRYGFPEKGSSENGIEPTLSGHPDARNTLLWIPDLKPSRELSVKAPDTPGTYFVIIRGVTTDNKVVGNTVSFRVVE
jgi:hypothetical protein